MNRRMWERFVLAGMCLMIGCGEAPKFSAQAQGMLKKFEQQMPQHKMQTFEQICKSVEKMHDDKKLTDEEYEALHRVCGQASTGQWDHAEEALKELVETHGSQK